MSRLSGLMGASLTSLLACVPERTKRLIFLASFSARLKGQDTFDRETLHKLNEVMALASRSSEAAINFPVVLSKVIWRGRVIHDLNSELLTLSFSKERLQQLVDRVLEAMPKWLHYASVEVMREDLARLLDHRSVLIGA